MTIDDCPWIEKYRPRTLDKISSQQETISVLQKTLESRNLPHCLFYGPPGTGKTSTILCLARQLYGPEFMKSRVLELNASDERGIQVIRDKIKNFAKTAVSSANDGIHPCPPFKLIILDEADSMTNDAQSALRRIMETYSKVTRFCLICNYISRIIEPLASRCAKFRFKPLDSESIFDRLNMISQAEAVNCSNQTIDSLVYYSQGDLRKAIMFLQSAYKLYSGDFISPKAIADIAGAVPEQTVENVLNAWISKDTQIIQKTVLQFTKDGYSGIQLISQINEMIINHSNLTGIQKSKMAMALAKVDKALADGADEELQILSLLVKSA